MNVSVRRATCCVALMTAVACALTTKAADQTVWPLTPYRVQVLVAVAPQPPLSDRLQAALCSALSARIDTVLGATFDAEVASAPSPLCGDMIRALSELRADQIPLPPVQIDKVLLVAVTATAGRMTVTVRDFDARTHVLNTPVRHPVAQIGVLNEVTLGALLAAFAPIARIERLEKDNTAVLRPKAIGLPLGDRKLSLLGPGDVLQPIIRINDRRGNFRKASVAPWSFCVVERVAAEEIRAKVYSGMRAAMSAKGRGRVESLALRVVPPGGTTTIVFQSRTEPKGPLGGCEVYSYAPGNAKNPALLGVSDQQGRFVVPSDPALLRIVLVKSGSNLLAKLPLVPGLEPKLMAALPNHDRRLEAEGFLFGLQEELVDLFARRKILIARIQMRIEEGQIEQAMQLMDELNRLPKALQFAMRITEQQERLTSPDKLIQKKIDTMFNDARQQVEKCLASDEIEALDRELRAARQSRAASPESKNGKG